MDGLQKEHHRLLQKGSLQKGADDVQKIIDQLTRAKEAIAADPKSAAMTLAKLQQPVKKGFEAVNDDMKEVYSALGKYSKALDKQFKNNPLPTEDNDALASHPSLINRAIAMHLLREGQFDVASTFISEANAHPPAPTPTPNTPNPYPNQAWEQDFAAGTFRSQTLQQHFAEMYYILHELRQRHNLAPAIEWARKNSAALEKRGSNLEFELCRLQYVCLFMSVDARPTTAKDDRDTVMSDEEDDDAEGFRSTASRDTTGPLRAWAYARSEFHAFSSRYSREIQALMGAMAFWQNVGDSPYRRIFGGTSSEAWDEVAASFTKEFCSLLGLSADSPLYVAGTAGAIALPVLMKLQKVMREKRTEWTTVDELPVEIPLPPAYHFHSIFVCPVSKEQATDTNPPMMMACGHVICKESMERLARTQKFKCPYCPAENHPREAKRVFL